MSDEQQLAKVNDVLNDFADPESGRGIVEMGQVRDVNLSDGKLSLTLALTTHSAPLWETTRQRLSDRLRENLPDLGEVEIRPAVQERAPEPLGQIGVTAKSVIAVASGKGGVGKSTIAASLAVGLRRAGCEVGLMDADVYGPSIPHLLGLSGRPEIREEPTDQRDEQGNPVVKRGIVPVDCDGMRVMSMGFMVSPDEAVIWRGPMLHGAITQFLRDTIWGPLDYLIIDMPPGTGDIALTLSQLLPLTGAVVVCTPQDVALLDAVKAIAMYEKVKIPVLGLVENMSYFLCPDNGKRYDIFGHGGAKTRAESLGIPFLGEVPINIQMRVHGDEGRTLANFEDAEIAAPLEQLCFNLATQLAERRSAEPPLPSLSVL
ncbi:MAG: iron-sulfur cluster carrier protein ApbC [Planctomycetota bacterium]|nr:MAG: iron-sulfur cluster carrier protein ApbC [Planctomycetota bacterium]REK39428.1 MAG: iron-sulfur cluster carrier protein ApbC [Planctomycetota bacterium]